MKSPRHLEALRYAALGIPIFPCVVNGKEPATAHGFKDATTDPEVIDGWWTEADYNLGLEPEKAGYAVIDVDPGGLGPWADLVREHDLGATLTVRTPRGGYHVYYSGSLPGSVAKLASGIDTRGRGSYVLVPPSIVNGKSYTWEAGAFEAAPLPEWIAEKFTKTEARSAAIDGVPEDTSVAISRATTYLNGLIARGDVAVEGSGGNDRTYRVASTLRDLGLSIDKSFELMYGIWNPHCRPPWTADELGVIIGNASRYAQNDLGADAVGTVAEEFAQHIEKLKAEAPPTAPDGDPDPFRPYSWADRHLIRPPTFLIPELLPQGISMWFGKPGSYKTFLALDASLGLSYKAETFGYTVPEAIDVAYVTEESASGIAHERWPAWVEGRSQQGDNPHFRLFRTMPLVAAPSQFDAFIARCKEAKFLPKLIVLDTAASAMTGMDENDFKDVSSFMGLCKVLRRAFEGASILIVHHTNRNGDYRGHSNYEGEMDAKAVVETHGAASAVSLTVQKMRDAPKRAEPFTFKGQMVGPAVVFYPIKLEEYIAVTRTEDHFSKPKIAAALQRMSAYGKDHGLLAAVLAEELLPQEAGQSQDDRAAARKQGMEYLNAIGKKPPFNAYCEIVKKSEGGSIWFLPAETAPDAL